MFDGSCRLIPVKAISDECIKLSEQFIVQLVDTLSSEMNPQVVCAVAGSVSINIQYFLRTFDQSTVLFMIGLCNSERVDKLLEAHSALKPGQRTECDVCLEESQKLADKIDGMDVSKIQDKLLEMCGRAGSYADACKATVIDNFEIIYG